jgi:hypothetical protein
MTTTDTSLLLLTVEIQPDGPINHAAGPTLLPRFRLGLWRWEANGGGLKAPAADTSRGLVAGGPTARADGG